jgi:hypothetical protein
VRKKITVAEERDELLERLNKSAGDVEEVIEKVMAGEISIKEARERTTACTITLKQLNLALRAERGSPAQVNQLPRP